LFRARFRSESSLARRQVLAHLAASARGGGGLGGGGVTALDLSDNRISTAEGVAALGPCILAAPGLEVLDLSHNKLGKPHAANAAHAALRAAASLPALRTLRSRSAPPRAAAGRRSDRVTRGAGRGRLSKNRLGAALLDSLSEAVRGARVASSLTLLDLANNEDLCHLNPALPNLLAVLPNVTSPPLPAPRLRGARPHAGAPVVHVRTRPPSLNRLYRLRPAAATA